MYRILSNTFDQVQGFFLPKLQENPITGGLAWGASSAIISHIFLQVTTRVFKKELANRDSLINLNAVLKDTSSQIEKYLYANFALQILLILPIGEELLFRGKIFTYVENNFSNAQAINLLVVPILFGILHLEPRQKGTNYAILASTIFLGSILTNLRQKSGGLVAPIVAHITHNLFGAIIGFAAASMGFVKTNIEEQKKEQ